MRHEPQQDMQEAHFTNCTAVVTYTTDSQNFLKLKAHLLYN